MNNVLVLCDKYYPQPSSNGNCAANIVKQLSQEAQVVVLTIYDDVSNNLGYYGERLFSTGFERINTNLKNKLFLYKQDDYAIKKIGEMIDSLVMEYDFQYIIGFYRPIEIILSGINAFKKHSIPFFPIFLDVEATNISNIVKKNITMLNYKRLYNSLTKDYKIFILQNYERYFKKRIKKSYHKNICTIGVPNIVEKCVEKSYKQEDSIDIVYTGSFYTHIRNPIRMLDYMKFIIGSNIKLHFYSWSCEEIVDSYKNIYGENLIIHGRIGSKEVESIIYNADFLLNLSNDTDIQIPGKIYEYFSTGKPIINFKFRTEDIGDFDYNKYPLILNIDLNNPCGSDDFFDFIQNNMNCQISFNDVKKIFYKNTPQYIIKKIKDFWEQSENKC